MKYLRNPSRHIAALLTIAMLVTYLPVPAVQAAMIGTDTLLSRHSERDRVRMFLEREDVQAELEKQGIDPREARARVDSLSDSEIRWMAGRLDQLPAGGDAVGAIIGAVVFIFVVLLITDLLGLTDVFPFVKKTR